MGGVLRDCTEVMARMLLLLLLEEEREVCVGCGVCVLQHLCMRLAEA